MERRVFEAVPHGYLILNRDLVIVDVNAAYARLTMTDPERIIGQGIFDVFPDNPGDPAADGVKNLTASLDRVIALGEDHRMAWQRYDIRDRSGVFVERHWSPWNCPVLDANGNVEFLIHTVADVTAAAKRLAAIVRNA